MKEMIAEALQENAERKEKLKKQLDWRSLELVVNRKEKDKSQVSAFRACHFKNKTVSKKFLVQEPRLANTLVQKVLFPVSQQCVR